MVVMPQNSINRPTTYNPAKTAHHYEGRLVNSLPVDPYVFIHPAKPLFTFTPRGLYGPLGKVLFSINLQEFLRFLIWQVISLIRHEKITSSYYLRCTENIVIYYSPFGNCLYSNIFQQSVNISDNKCKSDVNITW